MKVDILNQKKIQMLKNRTKEFFTNRLQDYELSYSEITNIVQEINEAFWEDILLEAYYKRFVIQFNEKVVNNEDEIKDFISSSNWMDFWNKNKLLFENYRGIEKYKAGKETENTSKRRYQAVRKYIDASIWEKIYPCLLLHMHDFELEHIEKNFKECIEICLSEETRELYKMSLIVWGSIEVEQMSTLKDTIEEELMSYLDVLEKHHLIEVLEIIDNETAEADKKLLREAWDISSDTDLESYVKTFYENLEREMEIHEDCKDINKEGKNEGKQGENKEEKKGKSEEEKKILQEDLKIMNALLYIVYKYGKKRKLAFRRIPCNALVFFKILEYEENDLVCDKGLVLRICDQLTKWIEYYLYIKNDEVLWAYKGLALNYYLRSNGLSDIQQWLDFSQEFYVLFDEMVGKVYKMGEVTVEYKQIEKLFDELKGLIDDSAWGKTKTTIEFLKYSIII